MNVVLDLHAARTPARDWRRVLVAVAALLVATGLWHMSRSALVDAVARRQLGCSPRAALIAEALTRRHPHLRPACDPYRESAIMVSFSAPSSACVLWQVDRAPCEPPLVPDSPYAMRYYLADEHLDLAGSILSEKSAWPEVPTDADGDGTIELVVSFRPACDGVLTPSSSIWGWATLRFTAGRCAVAGIAVIDTAQWARTSWIRPRWVDVDADGCDELVIHSVTPTRNAAGPPTALATLAWTGPGGVLRADTALDPNIVLVWTPADGQPHELAVDDVVEHVARGLLPLPAGFGTSPATASAPGTSSASSRPQPEDGNSDAASLNALHRGENAHN